MTKIEELEKQLADTTHPLVREKIQAEIQKLKLSEKSSQGDEIAQMLLVLKNVLESNKRTAPQGSVSKKDVEEILKETLKTSKIRLEDLDDQLRVSLTSGMKVNLNLTTPQFQGAGGSATAALYETTLFQKILSDAVSMNNIYLYGAAGTGKTFIAEKLAEFLGYEYIELSCNQFTSPLDILGGQTTEGYQFGKLERAWGNLDASGDPSKYTGAVLCLDELPKIDPNTAGILNGALAKVKNYNNGQAPEIENGRGDKVQKRNLIIIATGNVKLNETSIEYEANFKQDLSLQDRFVGSTYEVVSDYEFEANNIMKGFLFIWLAAVKLREKIFERRWTGIAFVSLRIMINLRQTYITYRDAKDNQLNATQGIKDALKNPKTIKNGFDSFLNLFKPDQVAELKQAMNYDEFMRTVEQKDTMSMANLDTAAEVAEAKRYVDKNKQQLANKIA
jgi:hypothetical protein